MSVFNRDFLKYNKVIAVRKKDNWEAAGTSVLDADRISSSHPGKWCYLTFPTHEYLPFCLGALRVVFVADKLGKLPYGTDKVFMSATIDPEMDDWMSKYDVVKIELNDLEWRYPEIGRMAYEDSLMTTMLTYTGEVPDFLKEAAENQKQITCCGTEIRKIEASIKVLQRTLEWKVFRGDSTAERKAHPKLREAGVSTVVEALSFGRLHVDIIEEHELFLSRRNEIFDYVAFDFPDIEKYAKSYAQRHGNLADNFEMVKNAWNNFFDQDENVGRLAKSANALALLEELTSWGKESGLDYSIDALFRGVPLDYVVS